MAEDVTNTVADATPVAPVANEENSVVNQEPQVDVPENTEQQPVENSNVEGEQVTEQPTEQVVQPELTNEELKARLKEYEVRDEEDRMMREKLGIADVDTQTYNNMNLDQQIVNEGKQVYLRLCNEYGVDANPNRIDASIEELKKTDPAKAYEFQRKFERLGDEVSARRSEVQQAQTYYEINKFSNEYNQLLEASPALNNIMTQYVQTYGNSTNMYGQLKNVMETIIPAYKEAFEAGKRFALNDRAVNDKSAVSGGVATANTQTYTPGASFTRDQISKMSSEEFARNEVAIRQAMLEGKIQ